PPGIRLCAVYPSSPWPSPLLRCHDVTPPDTLAAVFLDPVLRHALDGAVYVGGVAGPVAVVDPRQLLPLLLAQRGQPEADDGRGGLAHVDPVPLCHCQTLVWVIRPHQRRSPPCSSIQSRVISLMVPSITEPESVSIHALSSLPSSRRC